MKKKLIVVFYFDLCQNRTIISSCIQEHKNANDLFQENIILDEVAVLLPDTYNFLDFEVP